MSATQSMDTSSEDTTIHQNIQTAESMDIDGLPKHTAKKVTASTNSENNTLITTSPLPIQTTLTQNDKTIEPPKNSTTDLLPEKASVPYKKSHSTDPPGMKFSHDNSYIVIAPAADPHDDQDITMQHGDQTQDTQKVIEHVQETTIDEMGKIEGERKAILEDQSIYIDFELTNTGPTKKGDNAQSITSHTTPHRMDTDANSNATIEGTEIPHHSYSSVLKNKDQILQEIEAVDSTGWPDIVKTCMNNRRKALCETMLDTTNWHYDTILQAFQDLTRLGELIQVEANKNAVCIGTALAVCNSIQPYIQNVQAIPAISVMLDFAFPRNNKIRVISTYLPSNNRKLSLRAQHQIMEWIKTAEKRNHQIIVLGDFNGNLNNKQSKASTPILQFIRNYYMTSHIDYYAITEPTWQRGDRNNQIDDIWTTASLVPQCSTLSIISSAFLTTSDYKILMITWHHNLNLQAPRAKKNRWKVYLYNNMDQPKWDEFTKEVKDRLNKLNAELKVPITEIKVLDKTWHNLSLAIKQIATQYIPFTYKQSPPTHAYFLFNTKYYSQNKQTNR
ncbi:25057_t:CDS:2 [Gigaspora margarita]|uniref:25057_t:CDS:1 n=1 Tax=Gigaspora margarita TaxID=4874 RepID=A0ABN7US65_GIGMA|nr:25057_t:CDS:2 [Gigaspora margarita]